MIPGQRRNIFLKGKKGQVQKPQSREIKTFTLLLLKANSFMNRKKLETEERCKNRLLYVASFFFIISNNGYHR